MRERHNPNQKTIAEMADYIASCTNSSRAARAFTRAQLLAMPHDELAIVYVRVAEEITTDVNLRQRTLRKLLSERKKSE